VVEIPNRPVFRASEVCEIAQIPAYVLRSWEKEFPGLGAASRPGGARVYKRADVEQVVKIKHLLFAEGLTLAGARRRLEGEPKPEEEPLPELPVAEDVRDKVARVRQELHHLLDLLSSPPGAKLAAEAHLLPAHGALAPLEVRDDSGAETAAAVAPEATSWPPAPRPADPAPVAVEKLPLLNGEMEESEPPKPRRGARRAKKSAGSPD
jgi:DNA-binding transcriptional MerR regulator